MKLRKSAKKIIEYEKERLDLIKHELHTLGVHENALTEMAIAIYLGRRTDIEMVDDDYEE